MTAPPLLPALDHEPFVRALAESEEGSADWHRYLAGFLAVRLLDRWAEEQQAIPDDDPTVQALRGSIEAAQLAAAEVEALERFIGGLREVPEGDRAAILGGALVYGQQMYGAPEMALVGDLLLAVQRAASLDREPAIVLAAMELWLRTLLHQAQWAEHDSYSATLQALAREYGEPYYERAARANAAIGLLERGNVSAACARLDALRHEAEAAGDTEVLARALLALAVASSRLKEPDRLLSFARQALSVTRDPALRSVALSNIAASLLQMGYRDAAREALIATCAVDPRGRAATSALVNLVELASLEGDAVAYRRYRDTLLASRIPPVLRAVAFREIGRGAAALGQTSEARVWLDRAHAEATRQRQAQLVFGIEAELSKLAAAESVHVPLKRAAEPTQEIAELSAEIRAIRRLAEVGA